MNPYPNKTYFNWSSGKDSALALNYLLQHKNYRVEHLLTCVNAHHNRVSMPGLRRDLLLQQLAAIGIPYSTIELPEQPGMSEYEALMGDAVMKLKQQGFGHAAFGDIFLEDLRIYREQQLNAIGIQAVFPLWKKDTKQLLTDFLDLGFKTIIVCINAGLLPKEFAGKIIDKEFIAALPPNVDACGENGEFHTFCFDGPIFKQPVPFELGEIIYRDYQAPKDPADNCTLPADNCPLPASKQMGFWFADLLPVVHL